ncbi:ribonuclease HI [Galbibacter orientalis]|uniref:ribonuclease H n=1 Tax=Galbibacter orientalis DSM 19592 TaxID=926559 RepID=I3C384_9FLAO|nr:ribonuclease HI [Galbibacter orientalis]EIJ38077.1 ribonuclease HI [Galbibacter orientalis DSM 19592]
MTKHDVHIYTDGSSRGNPGPGGYGIVMEWVGKPYKKEFSEGFKKTTNNRMELLAVIEALKKLKKSNTLVKVFSDSKYVVDAVEKGWVFGWEKKNFKDKKNPDLWIEFLKQYRKQKVNFQWIKGHNNHPQNERCDFLAVEASKKPNLPIDKGFENSST